jgi:flavin reductase (DIM6/NTAB) family NADH-FMN oxidoreductase RutF
MNETSATLPHNEDEFIRAGLTAAPSRIVSAAGRRKPGKLRVSLSQCIQLTTAEGQAVDTWLVLGEVVAVHIDESLLDDGIYQTAKAQPILRAGGQAPITALMKACVLILFVRTPAKPTSRPATSPLPRPGC